jgi:membrane protein implicated in regulation of membrane protease activity
MQLWVVWLVLAVVLGAAELFTLSAALGLLGGAAALAAGAAALGLPAPLQVVVFGAGAAAGVWLVRPVVLRHLQAPPAQRFGVDALVGRTAHVVRDVTAEAGTVRIDGEEWSARPCEPADPAFVIPAGTAVYVMAIRGATALVAPQEWEPTTRLPWTELPRS